MSQVVFFLDNRTTVCITLCNWIDWNSFNCDGISTFSTIFYQVVFGNM